MRLVVLDYYQHLYIIELFISFLNAGLCAEYMINGWLVKGAVA